MCLGINRHTGVLEQTLFNGIHKGTICLKIRRYRNGTAHHDEIFCAGGRNIVGIDYHIVFLRKGGYVRNKSITCHQRMIGIHHTARFEFAKLFSADGFQ